MARPYPLQASPFAVPAAVLDYVDALLGDSLPAPRTLKERNVIQLALADDVAARFNLNPLDALIAVAGIYGDRFPHPAS